MQRDLLKGVHGHTHSMWKDGRSPVRQRRCVSWQSRRCRDDRGLTARDCPASVAPGYRVESKPQRLYLEWREKRGVGGSAK